MTAQPLLHPPVGYPFETSAVEQASRLAGMDNTIALTGMQDMHPGKGGPVGMAMLGELPVPAVLGNDLGCGFALFRLHLKAKRLADPAWVAERMDGLDVPMDSGIPDIGFSTPHDTSLGTIGGGNHFIEVGVVHASRTGSPLEEGEGTLLVHTGSRSFGEAVFRHAVATCRDMPLADWEKWISMHALCMEWAKANRLLAAQRAADALGAEVEALVDLPHNFVEKRDGGWLHRKGSSPADRGPSVLAGTRGTPTFLVSPHPATCAEKSLDSLPHGAGRRIARSAARNANTSPGNLREAAPLSPGRKGSRVVCGDPDLLLEERPGAYKDVRAVLEGMVTAGMGETLAELHPVATFKRSEVSMHEGGRDRTRSQDARAESIRRRKMR